MRKSRRKGVVFLKIWAFSKCSYICNLKHPVKSLIRLKEYINFSINRSGVNDDNEEPSDY